MPVWNPFFEKDSARRDVGQSNSEGLLLNPIIPCVMPRTPQKSDVKEEGVGTSVA